MNQLLKSDEPVVEVINKLLKSDKQVVEKWEPIAEKWWTSSWKLLSQLLKTVKPVIWEMDHLLKW